MRSQHMEQVERWATYVRENPTAWKKIHTRFINAQFDKHQRFIKALLKEPDGFDKIIKLYDIKNVEAYRKLLKNLK